MKLVRETGNKHICFKASLDFDYVLGKIPPGNAKNGSMPPDPPKLKVLAFSAFAIASVMRKV